MNKVILKGRITQDPELRTTINNKAVVRFTLAVNEGYGEKQVTNFINCEVWNKLAENLHKYCNKGSPLLLEGCIRTENYEQDGQKRYVTKVVVQSYEFLDSKKNKESAEESVSSIYTDEVEINDEDLPF